MLKMSTPDLAMGVTGRSTSVSLQHTHANSITLAISLMSVPSKTSPVTGAGKEDTWPGRVIAQGVPTSDQKVKAIICPIPRNVHEVILRTTYSITMTGSF